MKVTMTSNNAATVKQRVQNAIDYSLRLVGGQGERFAKETISDMGAVDTGLLRNSITYALGGEFPNILTYSSDNKQKNGKAVKTKYGQYADLAPKDMEGSRTVYIGTNVEYAPYVELGTTRMQARPFLSTAITAHKEEYLKLFKEAFSYFL